MLKEGILQVVNTNPEYAAVTAIIEKEILHHDIMEVMVKQGAMQPLTFIGGKSLRMYYNSSRLSDGYWKALMTQKVSLLRLRVKHASR